MRRLPCIPLLFTLLTAACTDSAHSPTGADKSRSDHNKEHSLSYKAWKMRSDGMPIDSVISVQRQAVDCLRQGRSDENPVEVLEQMGFFYNIAGNYTEAVRYYQEATDSLRHMPQSARNDGSIQLFGDLSSLYAFLGMYDQAIEYSDSAVAESRRQDGAMLSDVYRFRAGVYELFDMAPQASHAYDLALQAVEHGVTRNDPDLLRAMILGEKAHLLISAYPHDRDSVDWAVATLEKTLPYDDIDTTDRIYSLGLGYIKQGDIDRGLPLLRQAAESYREQEDVERINVANTALLETYAANGMCGEVARLMPEYIDYNDSLINHTHSNALIGAMVKYDLKSAEDRNRILSLNLEVEREKKIINLTVATLIILILLATSLLLFLRSRMLEQKRQLQEKQLSSLSESKDALHRRVGVLEKDLAAGMNSNNTILSDPQLITGKEEGRFRRAFNVLFPAFIPLLKQDYPKLTPNDELLCMLLYLKHTSDEISVYLGISRASVNSARYRLRTKFQLPKEADLDAFIADRPSA